MFRLINDRWETEILGRDKLTQGDCASFVHSSRPARFNESFVRDMTGPCRSLHASISTASEGVSDLEALDLLFKDWC